MEVDFAYALGKELRKSVELKEMKWGNLIPALERGEIDVIMSGMSITADRARKVLFTDPYFNVSQMMLIRRRDIGRFRQPGNQYYINSNMTIGVSGGTTGEELVRKYLPRHRIVVHETIEQGLTNLRRGKIDCYLHDSPSVWSYSDGKDPLIMGIYWKFSEEKLAWAVNKKNLNLRRKINTILDKWRYDGTTSKITTKWIPYRIEYK